MSALPQPAVGHHHHGASIAPLVASYMVASSTLLVANKWALELFPYRNLLMGTQFMASFFVVYMLGPVLGRVETDPLDWDKVIRFTPIVIIFYAVIWANMMALDTMSVDMVILFRSLTPFAVCIGDFIFLGRAWPTMQSWFALVAMTLCTIFIFVREPTITAAGVFWGVVYYVLLSMDMVYAKKIVGDVKLTTYGRVLYTNLLASIPCAVFAMLGGEVTELSVYVPLMDPMAKWAVAITCVLGYGMSYLSWALRAEVSALTFVVIGILCKIASVVINAVFLSKHLSLQSMILVCLGIVASTLYQQPKPRKGEVDVNKLHRGDASVHDGADDMEEPLSAQKKLLMGGLLVAILLVQAW